MSVAHLKALVGSEGHACLSLAKVAKHEGESDYFRVNADGDMEVDIIIDAHGAPVTAILGAVGGLGRGIWAVPPEGAEVLVAHAEGDFEGDAVLVCGTATGDTPGELDESTIVIVAPSGGKVIVHDGSGAQAMAYKSDVDNLRTWVAAQFSGPGHTHGVSGSSTNSTVPVSAPGPTPPSVVGSSVLEAK